MRIALAMVLALSFAPVSSSQRVITDVICGGIAQVGVVVSGNQLEGRNLTEISKSLMRRYEANKLLFVVFGTSDQSVYRSLHAGSVRFDHDITDSEAEAEVSLRTALLARGPIAGALFRFQGSAVLQSDNVSHHAGFVQLAGQGDPTALRLENSRFDIVHMSLTKTRTADPLDACLLTVFLQAESEFSISGGFAAQVFFQKLFPTVHTTTEIRTDQWFLGTPLFPDLPVLPHYLVAPSKTWKPWLNHITCWPRNWPRDATVQCGGYGFTR